MAEKEKSKVCKKVFILADGTESRHAQPGAVELQFRFSNGTVRSTKRDEPENVDSCLSWFGRSEKYGNSYAGADGDPYLAIEKWDAMRDALMSGEFVAEREATGPSVTLLMEAIEAFVVLDRNEAVDDKRRAMWRAEKLSTKAGRDLAMANPKVKAHFLRIKAERALTRQHEAEKLAEATTAVTSDF